MIEVAGQKSVKRRIAAAALAVVLMASFMVSLGSTAMAGPGAYRPRPGHVYLLRGLLNIFSLGLDTLAAQLQAAGVTATVHSYVVWPSLADDMIRKYRAGDRSPIILMGHSNGADATISLARKLRDANVPVALIVNFDPVTPDPVPSNVRQVVNFYVPAGWGKPVTGGAHYHGAIANVNENGAYNHFGIDKGDDLHRKAIALVLRVVGGGRTAGAHAAMAAH